MTRLAICCKALALMFTLVFAGGVQSQAATTAHDFTFPSLDGGILDLADHRGKVMLVVNTASLCGFTPQYEGLQALWESHRGRGFVLIGIPSGDFGGQELSSTGKIKDFCETNFGIDFPMSEKVSVSGPAAHAFYRWAYDRLGAEKAPRWNFHKYLVGRDGNLITSFATRVSPEDPELILAISTALDEAD